LKEEIYKKTKNLMLIFLLITVFDSTASGRYKEIDDNNHIIFSSSTRDQILQSVKLKNSILNCDKTKIDKSSTMQEFITLSENEDFSQFLMDEPILVFTGIKGFSVKGSKVRIEIVKFSELPEYKTPILKTYRNEKFTVKNFFGSETYSCTDSYLKSSEIDFNKKVQTDNSVWKKTRALEIFEIRGFSKDYLINSDNINYEKGESFVEIDLKSYIESSVINDATNLEIECVSCNVLSPYYQKIFLTSMRKVNHKVDFRLLKSQLQIKGNQK